MISPVKSSAEISHAFHFEEGEILLFNKPLTWTSFDLVNKVRWLVKNFILHHSKQDGSASNPEETVKQHERSNKKSKLKNLKVGHAGTLDPLATGLLIICTGKMTKSIHLLQDMKKEYTGTIKLGEITPSYDAETPVSESFGTSHLTESLIGEAVKKLTGKITQFPPSYSAKSVNGVRAYTLARKGKDPGLEASEVVIDEFEITRLDLSANKTLDFRVRCSKGTYIRSLAHDLGKEIGSGAYLSSLCRTKIGDYSVKDAWEVEKFAATLKR